MSLTWAQLSPVRLDSRQPLKQHPFMFSLRQQTILHAMQKGNFWLWSVMLMLVRCCSTQFRLWSHKGCQRSTSQVPHKQVLVSKWSGFVCWPWWLLTHKVTLHIPNSPRPMPPWAEQQPAGVPKSWTHVSSPPSICPVQFSSDQMLVFPCLPMPGSCLQKYTLQLVFYLKICL
jgi:hypothetical protein